MHDIRLIRDAPAAFDAALARRKVEPLSASLLALDEKRRALVTQSEQLLAERNTASKQVGAAKAKGDEAEFERLRALVSDSKEKIAALDAETTEADAALRDALMQIPNLPRDDIPDGNDEADNVEDKKWGTPPALGFEPKQHFDLGEAMGCMDFEAAAKLSGARFMVLSGALARLHRALAQFMLDTHVDKNELTEYWTPVLVRDEAMLGTGQLPKFSNDSYTVNMHKLDFDILLDTLKIVQKEFEKNRREFLKRWLTTPDKFEEYLTAQWDDVIPSDFWGALLHYEVSPYADELMWLIPTAEVTLTNTVAEEIIPEAQLPRRMTAHSQCFRSEAGSAGKDTRGMLRQHQFEKVEMVTICKPDESDAELERMRGCAEGILEALGLAYRTVVLCTGDTGFGARKTYDIEVWMPGQDTYREISSCSGCGDFQARRMNARWRPEPTDSGKGKPEYVHTLNGSGLAVGRCLIAVMENGQREDGSIAIPDALQKYMGGATVIGTDGVIS